MTEQAPDAGKHRLDISHLIELDLDGLLDMPQKAKVVTATDRLQRAFLEVVEFRRLHGRAPSSQTRDIAERKLGARLDGILASGEKIAAVAGLDEFGLLEALEAPASLDDLLANDDFDLLEDDSGLLDVSDLPTPRAVGLPDSVAKRTKATDFEAFKPLFQSKHAELADGVFKLVRYPGVHTIGVGNFFVLGGVMLFVAEMGETTYRSTSGRDEPRQRLRVIFENGTESSMYRQSLNARLHEADGQAVVRTGHDLGEVGDADVESGHIYVLQSLSDDPQIAGLKDLHKIGYSTTSVEKRIENAHRQPTYLMAPVRILEDYRTYNLKPSALEHLLHRVFAEVRLDLEQIDRKGRNYEPSEWFVVPLGVVNQAINMVVTGDIVDYEYDRNAKAFRPRSD